MADINMMHPNTGRILKENNTTINIADSIGATNDTEATGNGSVIGLLKRIRALLGGVVIAAGNALIGKVQIRNTANDADIDPLSETTYTSRMGATTDTEATGNGAVIPILKRIRTLLGGRIESAPVTGAKTVTTVAAAMFAGASRKTGRYQMIVYNESADTVYWGGSGVTTANGIPLLAGDSVVFNFTTASTTDIYFIAANNLSVRVVEL